MRVGVTLRDLKPSNSAHVASMLLFHSWQPWDSENSVRTASELVRRVQGGEEIDVTVSGRLAARIVPAAPKRWQSWDDIADVFAGRPDPEWERDRDLIDQSVADPWVRSR